MAMWFMHMHQLDTLYQSKGSKNSSRVIWGHRGQKCEFLQLKRLNKKTNRFNYCVIVWTHSNKVLIVLWLIWYFIEIIHVKFLTGFYIVPSSSRSLTLIYPAHFEDVPCQLESITFLKVRKIMYLDKAYIIVERNVKTLLRNKQKYK